MWGGNSLDLCGNHMHNLDGLKLHHHNSYHPESSTLSRTMKLHYNNRRFIRELVALVGSSKGGFKTFYCTVKT